MKKILALFFLFGCAYTTPPRHEWPLILRGASNEAMTPMLRSAKRPLYQETGGVVLPLNMASEYMGRMEARLRDTLRKPGVQINRIGTDIVVILVRPSFMYTDKPEISQMGDELLGRLARVLREFDMTWVEITGFTDAMQNQTHAIALSKDMADRVGVYLARNRVHPIRMFLVGMGSANPIADQSQVGRLTNLRVEIRLSAIVQ